jgi:mitogen-activated protein kinase kinase 3
MSAKRKNKIKLVVPDTTDANLTLPVDETLTIDDHVYSGIISDFTILSSLGEGAHGVVHKCRHKPSDTLLAIKRISCPTDEEGRKPVMRELGVCRRIANCPYAVTVYGTFFGEGDVWLCMELMDTSLDKFYRVLDSHGRRILEGVLRKITIAVVNALEYLHRDLSVIHRDVKPSNVLMDRAGHVKLCDYSISGCLVNSLAQTLGVGFYPYMAPERIKPDPRMSGYDVRSDVWSLGITMIEIATGKHPYSKWKTVFDQMKEVVDGESPTLPEGQFSSDFENFINSCLQKDVTKRPNYAKLLVHPFLTDAAADDDVNMSEYVQNNFTEFAEDFGFIRDDPNAIEVA